MTNLVGDHRERLPGPVYSWMIGDVEAAMTRAEGELETIGLPLLFVLKILFIKIAKKKVAAGADVNLLFCGVLNLVARLLDLIAGVTDRLIDRFTGFFCRAFVSLASRQCQKQHSRHEYGTAFTFDHSFLFNLGY
jgi:hypothetical protein